VCPNSNTVLYGKGYTFAHRERITGMKTACKVGHVYIGHDMFIKSHLMDAKSLTHVTV
jgi:hypothetical protein